MCKMQGLGEITGVPSGDLASVTCCAQYQAVRGEGLNPREEHQY